MKCYMNSEYRPLKSVLLSMPVPEIKNIDEPGKILYTKIIDYDILKREFGELVKAYKKFKIEVNFINTNRIASTDQRYKFNLMFARDLFFMTPRGAILSRMFSEVRRDEVKYAQRALKNKKISIIKPIQDIATFEGADALWVNEESVLVGVGRRTNLKGFLEIKDALSRQGVQCVPVPAPGGVLHLLGVLQFVDSDTALVRTELAGPKIIGLLKRFKIRTIAIPENREVKTKYAMNFVTVAPKRIIMSAGCPYTKKIYQDSGIKIAAEVPATQLANAAGGIACATGILSRD
ncbi:MAG: arginine deiminase family protein [Candidatus Omnitrophica bacterium]|nr:arginine deiminase family protein [Candidatus Omnitrophota bacterium]